MTSTTSRWLPEPFAVLDDKRGKITVTAWKEQLEEAAKKMAGKTGILLLRGQLPDLHRGEYYDESLLNDTIIDLFKRSSRKLDDRWTAEGAGEHKGCLELTNVGYANYKMQRDVLEEDLIDIIKATLKTKSDAHTYVVELTRRPNKTKRDHLRDIDEYARTAMVRGAQQAKKSVGDLIRDMQIVPEGDATPNPHDTTATEFKDKFTTFSPEMGVQKLFTGLDNICRMYDELHSEDSTENENTFILVTV